MKTLMGLVVFGTIFYWVWMWDKALKTKTNIIDHLPKDEGIRSIFIIVNLISLIIIIVLMLLYLP